MWRPGSVATVCAAVDWQAWAGDPFEPAGAGQLAAGTCVVVVAGDAVLDSHVNGHEYSSILLYTYY